MRLSQPRRFFGILSSSCGRSSICLSIALELSPFAPEKSPLPKEENSCTERKFMSTSRIVSSLAVSVLLSGALIAPSSAAQGDPAAGKATYDKTCGMCHGPAGKGDGPTAAVLPTKPRNHTDGNYMNPLTDDYLFKIIKE